MLRKSAVGLMLIATAAMGQPATTPAANPARDAVADLVGRLDFEKYKATIKGLTQFGDRRQGTERNRAAIDWIEAQLKSYGCTNTERLTYQFGPEPEHRVLTTSTIHPPGATSRKSAWAARGCAASSSPPASITIP